MLTGRQAWEELESPLQVMYAVGVERRRLPIPPGCPPALAKLLKECWRHNAPLRPSFGEIVQRLRQLQSQDRFKTARLPSAKPASSKVPQASKVGGRGRAKFTPVAAAPAHGAVAREGTVA